MDENSIITSLTWLQETIVDRWLPTGNLFNFPFGRSRHVFALPDRSSAASDSELFYRRIALVCDKCGRDNVADIAVLFDRLVDGGTLAIIVRNEGKVAPRTGGGLASALQAAIRESLDERLFVVRLLCDESGSGQLQAGAGWTTASDFVACVVEARVAPASVMTGMRSAAREPYESDRSFTRIETPTLFTPSRIVALKLDHLGDFIMGVPAIRKLRSAFPQSQICLVVGSWNASLARELGIADEIIVFDAMARNPSEEAVDAAAQGALLASALGRSFDLAIDLRSDHDTRALLKHVDAKIRAGIGTRSQFPFLDIFLPVDASRSVESAGEETFSHHNFESQHGSRMRFDNVFAARPPSDADERLLWGPGRIIRSGNFVFEPFIEISNERAGLLRFELAAGQTVLSKGHFTKEPPQEIAFHNAHDGVPLEFRVLSVAGHAVPDFRYFGAKLVRFAGESVLHQAEYLHLLVELVVVRFGRLGILVQSDA